MRSSIPTITSSHSCNLSHPKSGFVLRACDTPEVKLSAMHNQPNSLRSHTGLVIIEGVFRHYGGPHCGKFVTHRRNRKSGLPAKSGLCAMPYRRLSACRACCAWWTRNSSLAAEGELAACYCRVTRSVGCSRSIPPFLNTANYAQQEGGVTSEMRVVAGIRIWL